MTQENKSRLKTALGLENLRGLGDTLKQIKEVMETADGLQKTLGELANENSPLSRALANLLEAEGIKSLNEGNANISEEVRKKMTQELENKGKTIEELAAANKDLKEDKVISEVTSKVTAELDKRLPQPGNRVDGGSGESKLFKAIEDVVARKLEQLLGGGESPLTSEQIRTVVKEEVAQGGGNKKPEDMVDSIVNALAMGDRLREKLGVAGMGGRLLQNQVGDSGLRTDLVKVLLEDERERLKITQEHEATTQRNKHLGTLADTVKENWGTGIAALTAAAEEIKGSAGAKAPPAPQQQQVFECADCHAQFSSPAGWDGQPLKCPSCGREYTKEELLA